MHPFCRSVCCMGYRSADLCWRTMRCSKNTSFFPPARVRIVHPNKFNLKYIFYVVLMHKAVV